MPKKKIILEKKTQELLSIMKNVPENYKYWDGSYRLHYPPVFITTISIVEELNLSLAQLITTEVSLLTSTRRIVPVMILRSLIDCAMHLKAYLLYPNKEVFVRHYKQGGNINKLCVKKDGNRQCFTSNFLKSELEREFDGISDLYNDSCNWVHPNYSDTKHPFSPLFGGGRYGFRGKLYKQKLQDYTIDEIENGEFPEYDYEEERDIVDYAISVNKAILKLFEQIEEVYEPSEEDIKSIPYSLQKNLPPIV